MGDSGDLGGLPPPQPGNEVTASPPSPRLPGYLWAVFVVSMFMAMITGTLTLLLWVGREIGCSMESTDPCGSGTWLVVLVALAVAAFVVPIGVVIALKRDRSWAVLGAVASGGPAIAWWMAFFVIAG